MTREEQIEKAVSEVVEERQTAEGRKKYGGWDFSSWFKKGVKWADKYPKSPWISVVEDLPCNHDDLLESPNDITKYVLAMNETGLPRITYMEKFNNKWLWRGNFITHWMPIPKFE